MKETRERSTERPRLSHRTYDTSMPLSAFPVHLSFTIPGPFPPIPDPPCNSEFFPLRLFPAQFFSYIPLLAPPSHPLYYYH